MIFSLNSAHLYSIHQQGRKTLIYHDCVDISIGTNKETFRER